ncbi:MAG: GTP-binding protein [Kiloniellales bacterium]
MAKVRAELGAEAIILSTQRDEEDRGIRMTAAIESAPTDSFDLAGADAGPGGLDRIATALAFHRAPAALADRLIGGSALLPAGNPTMVLAGALDSAFAFAPLGERSIHRPLLLAGPPGAGKTATAAKLTARLKLAGITTAFATMDSLKAGARDQAKVYAEAIGVALIEAATNEALVAALAKLPKESSPIIDTAGTNSLDPQELAALSRTAHIAGAEMALVLSAGGDAMEYAETAIAFAEAGAKRLIVTKLDLTRRLGSVLAAAEAGGLAFAAIGTAPTIADGLLPINPVSLARLLLPEGEAAGGARFAASF